MKEQYDIVIIGSGAGGGTIAHQLADSGKSICIIERGDFLPNEKENWDAHSVFVEQRYQPKENWLDKNGKPFVPGTHYFVGGNTKFYGAALLRLRENDFKEVKHFEGVSPAWPLSYDDFLPYYRKAEALYHVHGNRGEDPFEPPENEPYPYPAVSHEPFVNEIYGKLQKEGLKPFHLPIGIHLNEEDPEKSKCIRCDTCDGYPCLVDAKSDAHITCIAPLLEKENVTLLTNAKAIKLITDPSGKKITEVLINKDQKEISIKGHLFITSCGAINSAALFLRSKNDKHPNGLANSSDLVGRNYMCHNNSAIVAVGKKKNPVHFQKTIGVNDFYYGSDDFSYPLGHIQLLGKVKEGMLEADAPFFAPKFSLKWLADHAVGWWITSEDLPSKDNRVTIADSGEIILNYTANNMATHHKLLKKLKKILNNMGSHLFHFPSYAYLAKKIPLAGVAHQVGTMKFGTDPKNSVLDTYCKTHDIDNLYVVDGSFFPCSGAVNPALTIIANAIRVGEHLRSRL
jgi:choline dehydrogenase-like flavoprotein